MTPPRVLYALNLDPAQKFGSIEEQIVALATAFRARSSLFLPLFASGLGAEAAAQYRAARIDAAWLDLRRFRPGTLGRLADLVRRERIDVVHWNFYPPLKNGYLWGLSALAPRVRHFYTDHISRTGPGGARGPLPRRLIKRALLSRYERALCVSDYVLGQLEAEGTWPEPARSHHFINTDRFAPDPATRAKVRAEMGADETRFVVLAVAQLIREKGVDVAIRAIGKLPRAAVLWVVGDGPEAGPLRDLARDMRIAGRVRFLGLQRDVSPYMKAADCFVCPSTWAEAAGLVNIEALACGLPVVASRIGGIPEFVEEGRTGLLFTPGDPRALADSLRSLMADPPIHRTKGLAARDAAVARHSIPNRISESIHVYGRNRTDRAPGFFAFARRATGAGRDRHDPRPADARPARGDAGGLRGTLAPAPLE